ncbi:MAG TPA: hypothetical protein VGK09_10675 [Rhodocyclaceae bacterium]|jgi:hypothetical protein
MANISRKKPHGSGPATGIVVLPTPKAINLHNLEAVRREMGRVYRDMRTGRIASQDGARLVYALGEMRKMFELCDLEKRIKELEVCHGEA